MSQNWETEETKKCNNYMDAFGYPKLLPSGQFKTERNEKSVWLDKLGQDVKITGREDGYAIWVDEKFLPGDINRQKGEPFGKLHVALHVHSNGCIAHGMLTESPDRYQADVWLFGVPYGLSVESITHMEVYASWCDPLRKRLEKELSMSMEDLFLIGKEMLEREEVFRRLDDRFKLVRTICEKKTKIALSFPLSLVEEVGFHGMC